MSNVAKLKQLVEKRSPFLRFATWILRHTPFSNRYRIGRRNTSQFSLTLLKKTKIHMSGEGNALIILPGTRLDHCHIHVHGNHNKISIGKFSTLQNVEIWIEDDENEIVIGEHTSFSGATHLSCIEGTKISIGEDCMFSANIALRTGDSHSITDLDGKRINPSKNVRIGNHVWIGNTVTITKGVTISDNSVVGTGSIVTKAFEEGNVVLAGNPAKILKNNISWDRERLPM